MSKNVTDNGKNKQFPVGFETDPAEDKEVRKLITQARVGMLMKHPFFGTLATRLKLVNADKWLPTAATDGRTFYYNTKFFKSLKVSEIVFVVGHEILHVVYDHFGRKGSRDHVIANCAMDFCVNADLKNNDIGTLIPWVLYDQKYEGWAFEEIYDDLIKNAKKVKGKGKGQKGEGECEGPGEGGPGGNGVLDDHDVFGDGDGKDGRPKKMTDAERRAMRDELKEAIISAASNEEAGNLPAGVQRLIDKWTDPKLDWRSLIQQQIQSSIKSDFTFQKMSRKGWGLGNVRMPGMDNDEKIDVVVSIDMSGSISDEMALEFLTEIKGIIDAYADYEVRVWCFDCDIYNDKKFDPTNGDELIKYVPEGGGGTDFELNWKYMKENDIEPKKFIMFTDGYPNGGWGDEFYCDTLFIINGSTSIKPPFGTYAYYDEAGNNQDD